jgi:hypothetical protein
MKKRIIRMIDWFGWARGEMAGFDGSSSLTTILAKIERDRENSEEF